MRVKYKRPSLPCHRCKNFAATPQFSRISEGDANAPILIIAEHPSGEECAQGKFFVSDAGEKFRFMFRQHVCPVEDCLITTMIKCAEEPRLANIRNCRSWIDPLLRIERKVIVCLGRNVLKHLFMRGASPPALNILLGRITRMPEHKATIVTLPEPEYLLLVTQDPHDFRYDPAAELQKNHKEMVMGLIAVSQALEE